MRLVAIAACVLLTGCASNVRQPASVEVAAIMDPTSFQAATATQGAEYQIGPSDKLAIRVLQVPDLSFEEIFVDASGYLQIPLVGAVKASGLTSSELAGEIARKLSVSYMRDPQVMVTVAEAAGQKVTVDGAVAKPGMYEMRGRTTLLQAVAMAEGATRLADLRSVAVFRNSGARPTVAVFDLQAIRAGQAADPVLLGDDVVVVDTSRLNARMQDVLQALPALSAFFFYTR